MISFCCVHILQLELQQTRYLYIIYLSLISKDTSSYASHLTLIPEVVVLEQKDITMPYRQQLISGEGC